MSDETTIHQHIDALVAEEHALRERLANKEITAAEEHTRLRALETELDQLWDLLRQRRARREYGQDPADAATRSESTVKGYLQ